MTGKPCTPSLASLDLDMAAHMPQYAANRVSFSPTRPRLLSAGQSTGPTMSQEIAFPLTSCAGRTMLFLQMVLSERHFSTCRQWKPCCRSRQCAKLPALTVWDLQCGRQEANHQLCSLWLS